MEQTRAWTVQDSQDLYMVDDWGHDYFSIDEGGRLRVHLKDQRVDLHDLILDLSERGLSTPLLLRFGEILEDRVHRIRAAFDRAIQEMDYKGGYRGVYPVKVNQQRQVLEEIMRFGGAVGLGLEVGSKPELLMALALLEDPERLLICNGFKDRGYLELALHASKLGRPCHIVADRLEEVSLAISIAEKLEVRPHLGLRCRLSSRGAGKWNESTGDLSKFGLSAAEIVQALETLRSAGLGDCVELLHFHIGSQISDIQAVKAALREASRMYCEIVRSGIPLRYLDVGGGLGVDYDGSQTNFAASKNYSLQEYANDIVWGILQACDHEKIAHPCIVSESGRATVAHHSVLVFDVRGRHTRLEGEIGASATSGEPAILGNLRLVLTEVSADRALENWHDLLQLKEEMESLFNLGYLSLEHRARGERLFWEACRRLHKLVERMEDVPEDLENLARQLADTYYCNFSLFQSLPDHWAVDQLFPVMPLHRLDEEPMRPAVLADLTCDSDGRLDCFIDRKGEAKVLYLHEPNGQPYYLGIFLVGAYQEVLGDLHNLFGDTHAVHVCLDEEGRVDVSKVVEGDTVAEVLQYVQYDPEEMVGLVRRSIERSVRSERISKRDVQAFLRLYKETLGSQTYLET
ncbi:MAG: biosynthetic arginine decarboxylase [Planctomycetota bacterium]